MGVDRTDYIVYGFKLHPNDLKAKGISIHDDKYLPYMEGHPDIVDVIVYDAMSGKYVVFGNLINKAEEHEGTIFTTISYKDFFDDEERRRVTDKFKELFGDAVYGDLEEDEPQMFVFSHYS
jgi:hypothetical protein